MPLIGDPSNFLSFRSTSYVEADESPSGAYSLDRGQVTRTYYVSWDDRDQAALDFAGTATLMTASDGVRYVTRTLPHALPSKTYMRCQSILSVKPMSLRGNSGGQTGGLGMADYEQAEITCQYVMPTFRFAEDADVLAGDGPLYGWPDEGWALGYDGIANSRYITRTIKFTTRELVVNRSLLKDSQGKLILEGFPLRESSGEVTYTHHQVPESAIPQQAWINGGSCVNEFDFDGWPAGTLLSHSLPEARPSPNVIDGQFYYDLTYRFALLMLFDRSTDPVTVRGHNYIRRLVTRVPNQPRFEPLLVTADGGDGVDPASLMFPPFDFASFFRPDQP